VTQLLALVGPTASGKTHIATGIAAALGAEVVCADSMTVYREMDVGTAKPDREARARVRHHLLDIADPAQAFSVAEFQRQARGVLADLQVRGRRALVVGGSGLYFRAVVDDLSFPPTDPAVRERLEAESLEVLASRLAVEDPAAAGFVDAANRRRVVRALEVIELTGRRFSDFRGEWSRFRPIPVAGLHVEADVLDVRIRARLRAMLSQGFLEEVRGLVARGYRGSLTASRAVAYPQALAHLDGVTSADEFVEDVVRATKRLARRQNSWFRRDPRIRWFDAVDLEHASGEVRAYYEREMQGENGA